jgi:hypothetical protein
VNLLIEGAHAAADWLLDRIREAGCEVSMFVGTHGGLATLYAATAKRKPGFRHVGDYGPGLKYREAVDDLAFLTRELEQARAEA